MADTTQLVSVEEYLRTGYRPDRELIDGCLKEKSMPTELHAFVQSLLGYWFIAHMEEWNVQPMSEVRTGVKPGRFRLPDVAVIDKRRVGSTPLMEAPRIAIEILSPDDSFTDLGNRAKDLAAMGTEHIWLLDPEEHRAFVWREETWIPTGELQVPSTPIYLDLPWLWSRLD